MRLCCWSTAMSWEEADTVVVGFLKAWLLSGDPRGWEAPNQPAFP
jgi:hypothetical protein